MNGKQDVECAYVPCESRAQRPRCKIIGLTIGIASVDSDRFYWRTGVRTRREAITMQRSKDIEAKTNVSALNNRHEWTVDADGKAFKISVITASRTVDSKAPDSFSTWVCACRCVMIVLKRFSISVRRFPQAVHSFGNQVPSPIVVIKVLKAFSSSASERHNTTSRSLECISSTRSSEVGNWKILTKEDESERRSDCREKKLRMSPSLA